MLIHYTQRTAKQLRDVSLPNLWSAYPQTSLFSDMERGLASPGADFLLRLANSGIDNGNGRPTVRTLEKVPDEKLICKK